MLLELESPQPPLSPLSPQSSLESLESQSSLASLSPLIEEETNIQPNYITEFKLKITIDKNNIVLVKVPNNKVPGDIVKCDILNLSDFFSIKDDKGSYTVKDERKKKCGKTVIFMVSKDMLPGQNILLLCDDKYNRTKKISFIPLDKNYDFDKIKKYVSKLNVTDLTNDDILNAVNTLTKYIDERELESASDRGSDSERGSVPDRGSVSNIGSVSDRGSIKYSDSENQRKSDGRSELLDMFGKNPGNVANVGTFTKNKTKSFREKLKSTFSFSGGANPLDADPPGDALSDLDEGSSTGQNSPLFMFVRSGETDMDKSKSVLVGNDTWIQKLISTSVAKNISDFNKLSNCYLTKSARLQAFNHGYNVIPEYLEANPNINKIKFYCSFLPDNIETAKLIAYGLEKKTESDYDPITIEKLIKPIMGVSNKKEFSKNTVAIKDYLNYVRVINALNAGENIIDESPLPLGISIEALKTFDQTNNTIMSEWYEQCKVLEKKNEYAKFDKWYIQRQEDDKSSGEEVQQELLDSEASRLKLEGQLAKKKIKDIDRTTITTKQTDKAGKLINTEVDTATRSPTDTLVSAALSMPPEELDEALRRLSEEKSRRAIAGGGNKRKSIKRTTRNKNKQHRTNRKYTKRGGSQSSQSSRRPSSNSGLSTSFPVNPDIQDSIVDKADKNVSDIIKRGDDLKTNTDYERGYNEFSVLGTVVIGAATLISDTFVGVYDDSKDIFSLKGFGGGIIGILVNVIIGVLRVWKLTRKGVNREISENVVLSHKDDDFKKLVDDGQFNPKDWPTILVENEFLSSLNSRARVYYLYAFCEFELKKNKISDSDDYVSLNKINQMITLLFYNIIQAKRYEIDTQLVESNYKGHIEDKIKATYYSNEEINIQHAEEGGEDPPMYSNIIIPFVKINSLGLAAPTHPDEFAEAGLGEGGRGVSFGGAGQGQWGVESGQPGMVFEGDLEGIPDIAFSDASSAFSDASSDASSDYSSGASEISNLSDFDENIKYNIEVELYTIESNSGISQDDFDKLVDDNKLKINDELPVRATEEQKDERENYLFGTFNLDETKLVGEDSMKSSIVKLLSGILNMYANIFDLKFKELLKYVPNDNIDGKINLKSTIKFFNDRIKEFRGDIVDRLDYLLNSINDLFELHNKELIEILEETRSMGAPISAKAVSTIMDTLEGEIEKAKTDGTVKINKIILHQLSLIYSDSTFDILHNVFKQKLKDGESEIGTGNMTSYKDMLGLFLKYKEKYHTLLINRRHLYKYKNILKEYITRFNGLYDSLINGLLDEDDVIINQEFDEDELEQGIADLELEVAAEGLEPGFAGLEGSDDSTLHIIITQDEFMSNIMRGQNIEDIIHRQNIEDIIPNEDKNLDVLMPGEESIEGNRSLINSIMYKGDLKKPSDKYEYKKIKNHWYNILSRQCAYFDESLYINSDMCNPNRLNLSSIVCNYNSDTDDEGIESTYIKGKFEVRDIISPPDLTIPLNDENFALSLFIIKCMGNYDEFIESGAKALNFNFYNTDEEGHSSVAREVTDLMGRSIPKKFESREAFETYIGQNNGIINNLREIINILYAGVKYDTEKTIIDQFERELNNRTDGIIQKISLKTCGYIVDIVELFKIKQFLKSSENIIIDLVEYINKCIFLHTNILNKNNDNPQISSADEIGQDFKDKLEIAKLQNVTNGLFMDLINESNKKISNEEIEKLNSADQINVEAGLDGGGNDSDDGKKRSTLKVVYEEFVKRIMAGDALLNMVLKTIKNTERINIFKRYLKDINLSEFNIVFIAVLIINLSSSLKSLTLKSLLIDVGDFIKKIYQFIKPFIQKATKSSKGIRTKRKGGYKTGITTRKVMRTNSKVMRTNSKVKRTNKVMKTNHKVKRTNRKVMRNKNANRTNHKF